jgi:hypothetical protein
MAYTPELSLESSQILRRIAWALEKPMTETLDILVRNMSMFVDREKICLACRDHSLCGECVFSEKNHQICPKAFR